MRSFLGDRQRTPAARVYRGNNLSVGHAARVAVPWEGWRYKRGHWSTNANTELIIPQDGLYLLIGNLSWTGNTSGTRLVQLIRARPSTLVIAAEEAGPSASAGNGRQQNIQAVFPFAKGEGVSLVGYQESGGPLNITGTGEAWAGSDFRGLTELTAVRVD